MKLVMTLLVRDEADIIHDNLEYHLSRGVDFFVVTDNGSVDGTREVLDKYVDKGLVMVIDEEVQNFNQGEWVTRMARIAHTEHHADWIINADADEFWWPVEGDLKLALDRIPPEYGAISVPMLHFIPFGNNKNSVDRMILRFRSKDRMKTCHRGYPDIEVGFGNHRIRKPDVALFPGKCPLKIFHFPERSFEQFERKIKNGGKALTGNPKISNKSGTHWRQRYKEFQHGTLRDTWDKSIQCGWLRAVKGLLLYDLVIDKRLAGYMRNLCSRQLENSKI